MMKRRTLSLFAALVVTVVLTGIAHAQMDQKDFTWAACRDGCLTPTLQMREKGINSALVLPAQVNLIKQGVKGVESQAQEAEIVSLKLRAAVSKALQAKGLKLAGAGRENKPMGEQEEERASVSGLQKRYDAMAVQLKRKPKEIKKGRYTLGDEVANFAPGAGSDTIVFIRAYGQQRTRGKNLLSGGGLLALLPTNMPVFFCVSLVDAQTGQLLYVTGNHFVVKENELPEKMENTLTKMFKKLPTGS